MYRNPYLRQPDVPGASRCKFVFYGEEVSSRDDIYRGKKRYRFNKWLPVSQAFPRLHSDGMIFQANQECNLSGIVSAWDIDPDVTGVVEFLLGPTKVNKWDAKTDILELGVGFLKYDAPWWGLAEGCSFICRRTIGVPSQRAFYTIKNSKIPGNRLFNPDNFSSYILEYDPNQLSITYTEYTASGVAITTDTFNLPLQNVDNTRYRIVLYLHAKGKDCNFEIPLVRTRIDVPNVKIAPVETIYFLENPSAFTTPVAQIRDHGIHLYHAPHRAMIEDSTITVANSWASHEWLRTLDFLITGSMETFLFTDPDGTEFRCCFEDLTANSARLTASKGVGYELRMPIVVVH